MKTTQHTPGPWKSVKSIHPNNTDCWRVEIREDGWKEYICTNVGGCLDHPGGERFRGTKQANAALIAAAPELLEALEKVMASNDAICNLLSTAYGRLTDNDMMPPNNALKTWLKQAEHVLKRDWQDQARAAIAKAKGK